LVLAALTLARLCACRFGALLRGLGFHLLNLNELQDQFTCEVHVNKKWKSTLLTRFVMMQS